MAKSHASLVKVYYDGYDFSSVHNRIDLTIGRVELIRNVFGQVGVGRQAGLPEFEIVHEGYIERGATAVEDIIIGNIGTADKIMTVCPTTGAVGEPAYSAKNVGLSYAPTHKIGELQGFVGAGFSQGDPIVRGQVLATGAKTETGNGAAKQFQIWDTEQGNLSYTTEGDDKTFTDDGQDFGDWDVSSGNAKYQIVIINDDSTVTWGYLGAEVSATEVKVYQEITLATSGWSGQDPTGKTPSTYAIRTAGQYLYGILHCTAVSGTNTPTITVKIQSDSTDAFSSASDRITFTAKTAIGSQWATKVSADTITDNYWRASWTVSGTNPSLTVHCIAAIQTEEQ